MKILDEWEMSHWAYEQCEKGNDTPEIRKLFNSQHCYCYCKNIKDRPELWSKINDPDWSKFYCEVVKNRPEVRKYIK